MGSAYALITAAKNEEAYIHQTLQSVVNQTRLPKIWIIISDGSTDHTDEFVMDCSRKYDFIRLLRFDNQGARTFSSKVFALNGGYEFIKKTEFEFVGFLDADISFDSDYCEKLLKIFKARPGLGIVGGEILEYQSGRFQPRFGNSESDVAGATQFFRRQCYEDIGSRFVPLQYGGYDFVANVMARKKGWEVQSVSGLPVFHHRRTGAAGMSLWRTRFREGMADYFMGYQTLFEICKCIRRVPAWPFCIGSTLLFFGYFFPRFRRQRRTVPDEFVRYLRQEQLGRILRSLRGLNRGISITEKISL